MHIYTQLAVSDLDTSLAFYRQLLGLTEHRRDVCLDPQLTRVYIGFAGTPQPDALCLVWHADHAAARDCLCHFGHLAVVVDNVTHICNRASQLGHFVISMPTSANVAYLQDPDGYAIKLVQAGEHP
jgi:lactoylglutathione lyase